MFTSSRPRTLDVVTANATISSCEKGSQWGHALHIFHTVPKMAIEADTLVPIQQLLSVFELVTSWLSYKDISLPLSWIIPTLPPWNVQMPRGCHHLGVENSMSRIHGLSITYHWQWCEFPMFGKFVVSSGVLVFRFYSFLEGKIITSCLLINRKTHWLSK